MTSTESTTDANLERDKLALDRERFELEKQQHELERQAKAIEFGRCLVAQSDSVLGIVKYLNELRDQNKVEIEEGHQSTTVTRLTRDWNPLEEQLANASVKTLCHLVGAMGCAKVPREE